MEATPARESVSAGPVAPHINSFIEHLASVGYRRATIRNQCSLVRTFDRWISDHHVTLADVDEHVVDAFLDESSSRRRRQRGSGATLHRLLTYLRTHGVTRPTVVVVDDSPLAQLEKRYRHYLRAARGLCATTVQTYVGFLRQFVSEHVGAAAASFATVSASDVATFVQRHAPALVLALQLVVEDDTFDMRTAVQETGLGLFVRAIDLKVVFEFAFAPQARVERLQVLVIVVAVALQDAAAGLRE
jgi:hypothetical protein